MTDLRILLLGQSEIYNSNELVRRNLSQKAIGLLAYLLMAPPRGVIREELSCMFWGDSNRENANFNLRRTLWNLRKAINLPDSPNNKYLVHKEGRYLFNRESDFWLDTFYFEEIIGRGLDISIRRNNQSPGRKYKTELEKELDLRQAADLYRGDFLEGCKLDDCPEFQDWLFLERHRFRKSFIKCMRKVAFASEAKHDYRQAVEDYLRILKVDPLEESIHRGLMVVYTNLGQRDKALEQYYLMENLLRQQMDVEPIPASKKLYKDIRDNNLNINGTNYSLNSNHFFKQPLLKSGPFIGRFFEQRKISEALEAVNKSRGHFVAVTGEAGVGKTRLIEEFLGKLVDSPYTVLRARCFSQEKGLPFQPIIDAFRLFLSSADLNLINNLSNLWLTEIAKILPEMYGYFPHLLMSSSLSPDQERNRMFEGIAQFIVHLSRRFPVLLFIDDFDEAGIPTLELVHFLVRRLEAERFLLLVTIRAENLSNNPDLANLLQEFSRHSQIDSLTLSRFSKEEVMDLMEQTIDSHDNVESLGGFLFKTGGNPFFLIEMLKEYQENQDIPSDLIVVPSNLQIVIENRLSLLEEESRQILIIASVIGRQFRIGTLRYLSPVESHNLFNILDRLISQGWIEEISDANPGTYDFNHGLVQEAVYQTLSSGKKQYLHNIVGQALEKNGGDIKELAGVLAHHFGKSKDDGKAVKYALEAASHARKLYALNESIFYYLKVLEISEHSNNLLKEKDISIVKSQLGYAYELIGQYNSAIDIYQGALQNVDLENDIHRRISFQLARVFDRKGQYDHALEILETIGAKYLEPSNDQGRIEAVMIYRGLASVYWHREQNNQALIYCKRALTFIEEVDSNKTSQTLDQQIADLKLSIFEIMANSYFQHGDYEESISKFLLALQIAKSIDQRHIEARLLIGQGKVAHRRGQYIQAAKYVEKSLVISRNIGHISGEAAANLLLGDVAYNQGHFDQALTNYEKACSIYNQIEDQHGIADSLISIGFTLIEMQDLERAEGHLLDALDIGLKLGSTLIEIRAKYNLARVAFGRGLINDAKDKAEEALQLAKKANIQLLEAAGNHQLGVILSQFQELGMAEYHIIKALNQYEYLGDIFETAWVKRSLAELLINKKEFTQALPVLNSALALFSEMGAKYEVKRTTRLLEQFSNRKK